MHELCYHTVPLQETRIEVLCLDALHEPREDEVEHALHPRVGLNGVRQALDIRLEPVDRRIFAVRIPNVVWHFNNLG